MEANVSASKAEMLACVNREIKMRERVYPERVASGRMLKGKAQYELRVMRAVLDVIAALPDEQTEMFGGGS
jgi:hypothetical protein